MVNKNLFVKYSLQKNKKRELALKAPKAKKSKRNITLMKETIKALRHHKNIQKLNKRILGDEYIDKEREKVRYV